MSISVAIPSSNQGGNLHELSAVALSALMRERLVSAAEVLEACIARIEDVNGEINALVSLDFESARERATQTDEAYSRGQWLGPLHGLPMAIKDTADAVGFRSTYGSPLYRDHHPTQDSLHVERIREAGATIVGKSNVPEFGAGSHTFNRIFGTTANPYDTSRSAGGSSGGAAAALAARMLPLADGSDMGGSLRNPASFCNVVGFRPSPGRVPARVGDAAWSPFVTAGPMARTVDDVALLFSVMAGHDSRSPIALETPGPSLVSGIADQLGGLTLAWSPDLGGVTPVEPEVTDVLEAALPAFESLGCTVESACPDFGGADEVFQTMRGWLFHSRLADAIARQPDQFKETVRWNTAVGDRLSGSDLARAERLHGIIFERVREFFTRYDALLLPVSQVVPFPKNHEYPTVVAGVAQQTYIDWMQSSHFITVAGSPAISVPAGFTSGGLPVGLQIVGPHHADRLVLQIARGFQQWTRHYLRTPPSMQV